MKKKSFPLSKVYQLLEPGPVVLVSTSLNGKPDVMTLSWHMMIDFEPPIVGCVISNRNYTFKILEKTGECVLNIPTVDQTAVVVGIGNCSGRKVDKFKKFHLLHERASMVNVPILTECYANLECKIHDMSMVSTYNIFILEVLKAWISPSKRRPRTIHHCGEGVFVVDGKRIQLPSKMK